MLTVDFDRLGLQPGDRVLDMGCGAGRHAFEMYRRAATSSRSTRTVTSSPACWSFGAMREQGEVPLGAEADIKQGDALAMPFADEEFDRVVASEVLEHIPDDETAIAELVRVLRPGGTIATVPRWLPEKICWALSTSTTRSRAATSASTPATSWSSCRRRPVPRQGPRPRPALAVLVDQVRRRRRQRPEPAGEGLPPGPGLGHHEDAALEHRTRLAERALNPLIGKSMVLYLRKPDAA